MSELLGVLKLKSIGFGAMLYGFNELKSRNAELGDGFLIGTQI